jgi:hypothetical protein
MRILVLLVSLGFAAPALAHHPGSHATRGADGRVRIEAVAVANDRCSALGPVAAGAPGRVTAPAGTVPVTVQRRVISPGATCPPEPVRLSAEGVVEVPRGAGQIMLYVLGPDGEVQATERIPVR